MCARQARGRAARCVRLEACRAHDGKEMVGSRLCDGVAVSRREILCVCRWRVDEEGRGVARCRGEGGDRCESDVRGGSTSSSFKNDTQGVKLTPESSSVFI